MNECRHRGSALESINDGDTRLSESQSASPPASPPKPILPDTNQPGSGRVRRDPHWGSTTRSPCSRTTAWKKKVCRLLPGGEAAEVNLVLWGDMRPHPLLRRPCSFAIEAKSTNYCGRRPAALLDCHSRRCPSPGATSRSQAAELAAFAAPDAHTSVRVASASPFNLARPASTGSSLRRVYVLALMYEYSTVLLAGK